ncbi:MAG: protein kinase domain-containing protein, partial [Microcystaceae cyanobacterium]
MSYCLNPSCEKPAQNLPQNRFCQCCGSKLLLKDRYRALSVIGQGGFGKTFLAEDEGLANHPHCVIKQFFLQGQSRQVTEKAIALFKEEAKRLEKLGHHSQIPKLYTYLEQNNQLYIVQEFIEGQTLTQELKQQGAFTEQKVHSLLLDLLPVLQFIHRGQVIHRDIKPDNIIRRNTDNKLVLVDFGAAKEVTQTALMKTGTIIGSAGYTAPEQAHG